MGITYTKADLSNIGNGNWSLLPRNMESNMKNIMISKMPRRFTSGNTSCKSWPINCRIEILAVKVLKILAESQMIAKAVSSYDYIPRNPEIKTRWQYDVSQLQNSHDEAKNEIIALLEESDPNVQIISESSLNRLIDNLVKSQLTLAILQQELTPPKSRSYCVIM